MNPKSVFQKIICAFSVVFFLTCQTFSLASQTAPSFQTSKTGVIDLSLHEAVAQALKNHYLMRSSLEKISESEGISAQTLSDLLPHFSGSVYKQRVWRENFATQGVPEFGSIGPFDAFDARLAFTQNIFDMSAVSKSQTGLVGVEISKLEHEFAKQRVVLAATLAYLEALHAYNGLEAAYADYGLSGRLFLQAAHQREAGVANGVDVARAKTRLAQEKLRLAQARLFYHESMLELARVLGLPFNVKIRLADSIRFSHEAAHEIDPSVLAAETNRLEVKIAQKNVLFEEHRLNEASLQYVPKVELAADYGSNGPEPDQKKVNTGQGMIRATMPFFEGGLIQGQIRQSASRKEQAKLLLADTRIQVEEDVRVAIRRVETGKEKVISAQEVVVLAKRELEMAKDRFDSGVGDNIEVLSAQTALSNARQDRIASLAQYHMARVNLFSAMGQVEQFRLYESPVKEIK